MSSERSISRYRVPPNGRRLAALGLALSGGVSLLALPGTARAQALPPAINVCAGPSINLPVLQPVTNAAGGLLTGLLAPVNTALGGLVGNINTNVTSVLSGAPLSVSLIDANGNLVSVPSGSCSLSVNNARGITVGGGQLDGLGGTGNALAVAGAPTAVAIGNGAVTGAGLANATAFGTSASVTGAAGTAMGAGAAATTAGSVALGAGSIADRLNAPAELFTGSGLRTTLGVVSVGTAGNERQIANVAGGTAPTDAVNVRQLSSVGANLAGALGSGAGFSTTTGVFTRPGFVVGATTYTDVGSAIAALQVGVNPVGPGLVAQATPTSPITVGAATAGTDVTIAGTAGTRTLSGVTAGTLAAGSTQAVNGGQLFATNQGLATTTQGLGTTVSLFGSGAAYNPATGTLVNPTYVVGGTGYGDVGSAIAALQTGANPVGPGLVAQATPTSQITIGAATAGTSLSIAGTAGARTLTGVAGGTVAAGSLDAVNGGQLAATNAGVQGATTALGGGATFDAATGAYTAPTYTVQGNAYTNVGSAIGALDRGSLQYDVDPATGTKSNTVTLAGGDPNTPVLLRNVASGTLNTDAANLGQVRQAQSNSMAYTDQRAAQTLQDAKSYTDQQVAAANFGNDQAFARLNQDIREVRREARQAAAVGLAAASLRYDDRPGKISLAAGGGGWRGEAGAAFGIGYTSPDGGARFNAAASTSGNNWGVGGGLSITLN